MLPIRGTFRVASVWLTALMTLASGAPHLTCVCPNGHVKPFCLSVLPGFAGCCCGASGRTPDDQNRGCCCCSARHDGAGSDPGQERVCCHSRRPRHGAQDSSVEGSGCRKTLTPSGVVAVPVSSADKHLTGGLDAAPFEPCVVAPFCGYRSPRIPRTEAAATTAGRPRRHPPAPRHLTISCLLHRLHNDAGHFAHSPPSDGLRDARRPHPPPSSIPPRPGDWNHVREKHLVFAPANGEMPSGGPLPPSGKSTASGGRSCKSLKTIQARLRFFVLLAAIGGGHPLLGHAQRPLREMDAPRRGAGGRRRRQRVLVPDAPHRRPRPPGQVPHLRHAPVQTQEGRRARTRRCRPASSAASSSRPTASPWPASRPSRSEYRQLTKEISAAGFVEFDERKLTRITAHVTGRSRIDKLYVNVTGQTVKEGDPLAELYSPDLVATVQNLLDAHQAGNKGLERHDPRAAAAVGHRRRSDRANHRHRQADHPRDHPLAGQRPRHPQVPGGGRLRRGRRPPVRRGRPVHGLDRGPGLRGRAGVPQEGPGRPRLPQGVPQPRVHRHARLHPPAPGRRARAPSRCASTWTTPATLCGRACTPRSSSTCRRPSWTCSPTPGGGAGAAGPPPTSLSTPCSPLRADAAARVWRRWCSARGAGPASARARCWPCRRAP